MELHEFTLETYMNGSGFDYWQDREDSRDLKARFRSLARKRGLNAGDEWQTARAVRDWLTDDHGIEDKEAGRLPLSTVVDMLAIGQPQVASKVRIKSKCATNVNARMLETIQERTDCLGWSARNWAAHLKCSKSAVADAKTFKDLQMRREREKAERAQDRRQRRKSPA